MLVLTSRRHDRADGAFFIGHSGEIAGFAARANWYPEHKLAVVVLMNSIFDSSPTALVEALVGRVLAAEAAQRE